MKPVVLGVSGPRLLAEEAALFRRDPPAGVILFARNIADRAQLAGLIGALRDVLPPEAVIMVDQEGGRVARLRPPHWAAHPAAGIIAALHARNATAGLRAAWLHGAAIGTECREAGFDTVAAPVLDLAVDGQDNIVGDRSFGGDPVAVAALGGAMAAGLAAAGVIAIGKHAPGHGRARVDSHVALPRVAACGAGWASDKAPFQALAHSLTCMMTAHILYEGLDDERPATLSARVIRSVIREEIGFSGLLFSDDLAMKALNGAPLALALGARAAGCDIALYCPGDDTANRDILVGLDDVADLPDRLRAVRTGAESLDLSSLLAERSALLGVVS